ncbi:hypothetical protein H4Q26_006085 [Puccinia striiformis f. sp. tritici PST-130]|nr:hypothetical protein H4Q26_006085 [Puccinia striiformis f. sp. tritici PST-130]
MLAKAYIQVCLPMKNSHGGYKSGIDRFLTRIKIPQSGYHSVIADPLLNVDERLSAIHLEPLKEGDWRLQGTPWARLTVAARDNLNSLVHKIYTRRKAHDAMVANYIQSNADIQKFEQTHLREIPSMIKIIESCLRDAIVDEATTSSRRNRSFMLPIAS